jgi:hypothetical protein
VEGYEASVIYAIFVQDAMPFRFLGASPAQTLGSGFPLQLLRNFRYNPLRLADCDMVLSNCGNAGWQTNE